MTARIRPVTDLHSPRFRIVGSARANAAAQLVSGSGDIPLAHLQAAGAGSVTTIDLGISGTGAIVLKPARIVGIEAHKRSRGAGTVPTKKLALAATGATWGPAVSAVVALEGGGWGPSSDPGGVLLGQEGLTTGDLWWASDVPTGCTVTPLAGGSFILSVLSSVSPGTYAFTWTVRIAATHARTTGTRSFTVV